MTDLATRRAYFDDYADTIEELHPSLVRYGVRLPCAQCGYPTLREKGRDESCFLCAGGDDSEEARRVKRELVVAWDAMPETPMRDHERLWSLVVEGMERLHGFR